MKRKERLLKIVESGLNFELPKDIPDKIMVFCNDLLLTPEIIDYYIGDYKIKDGVISMLRTCAPDNLDLDNLTLIDSITGARWVLNTINFSWIKL